MTTSISGSTGINKIQNDAVDIADLSATGTASASTFLRGDNSWTAVDALPAQSGNAGKFLTTDASTASWAEAGGGKILQVVESTSMDTTTITSTSFQDLNLSVSITPSSTSSKILVMADFAYTQDGGSNHQAYIQISRDSTAIGNHLVGYDTPGGDVGFGCHIQKLDAPSTSSSITYKAQARTIDSLSQFRPKPSASIIAMEIAG